MTKKDFELIANALYRVREDNETWENVLASVMVALATTNPRFDAQTFSKFARTGGYK